MEQRNYCSREKTRLTRLVSKAGGEGVDQPSFPTNHKGRGSPTAVTKASCSGREVTRAFPAGFRLRAWVTLILSVYGTTASAVQRRSAPRALSPGRPGLAVSISAKDSAPPRPAWRGQFACLHTHCCVSFPTDSCEDFRRRLVGNCPQASHLALGPQRMALCSGVGSQ